jgi:ankyrin repeat protein
MNSGFIGLNDRLDGLRDKFEGFQLSLNTHFSKPEVGRERLLEWLNGIFTDEEYERALASRLAGTCDWFLRRSQFRAWAAPDTISDTTRILWVHGPPGLGKTVLCARLVEHLHHNQSAPVASFFCISENEAKRQPLAIVRSWVAQMVNQNQDALEAARDIYRGKEARTATTSDVWQLFRNISLTIQNCVFVVDGFDECIKVDTALKIPVPGGGMNFLRQLVDLTRETGSRILFVSRDDADIRSQFSGPTDSTSNLFYDYEIIPQDTHDDISFFSSSVVDENLPNKPSTLRKEIAEEAARRCEGMFLWIRLLRGRISPGKNAKQLRETVSETPVGLEQTYERDLENILNLRGGEKDRAVAILRWTLFAQRPLTVREMTEALIVDVDDDCSTYPSDDLPDAWDEPYINDQIRRLCGSLIELRGREEKGLAETRTVHFVHFSVREYLSSATSINFPMLGRICLSDTASEHNLLAQVCLHYLCYDNLKEERHPTKEILEKKINQYQFLTYSARSWHLHALYNGDCSQNLIHLINKLFDPLAFRWILWSEIFESEEESFEKFDERSRDNYPSPLYYASLLGFTETLEYLRIQGLDLNARGGKYGSALQAAAVNNRKHTVEFLLKHGANVNISGGEFGSAIAGAASNGTASNSEAIIQLLIAGGADISKADDHGRRSLYFAAQNGAVNVVELLLERKAEVRSTTTSGQTALHVASHDGHEAVVKLLLDGGAEVKAADNKGWTPLHVAARNGHEAVVKLLLDGRAEVKAAANEGWTPLHDAAWNGHEAVIKLLLERGAEVKAADNEGWTALHDAARNGHEAVVKLLLDGGAEVKAADNEGWTPLHDAARNGHEAVVKLLLERGAEVKAAANEGWTPLHNAALNGHEAVVKLLLDGGAEVKAAANEGVTPLHDAARNGYEAVVKLLLDGGAEVKAADNEGWTPLHDAARNGHEAVVKLLLDGGAEVKAADNEGWTALHVAAENGHETVVKLLLENGAVVNSQDREYRNMLQAAAYNGKHILMELLTGKEINPDIQGEVFQGALQLGCIKDHMTVVEQLICQGANPNMVDEHGWTPLLCASWFQQGQILDYLLLNGGDRGSLSRVNTIPPDSWSRVDKSTKLQLGENLVCVRYSGK